MIVSSLIMMLVSFLGYMFVCDPNTKETNWKEDLFGYIFFAGAVIFVIGCILWVVSKL